MERRQLQQEIRITVVNVPVERCRVTVIVRDSENHRNLPHVITVVSEIRRNQSWFPALLRAPMTTLDTTRTTISRTCTMRFEGWISANPSWEILQGTKADSEELQKDEGEKVQILDYTCSSDKNAFIFHKTTTTKYAGKFYSCGGALRFARPHSTMKCWALLLMTNSRFFLQFHNKN